MKTRIYADTSVLGGCEDDEFRDYSRRLPDAFIRGDYTLVLSELTIRELETAPVAVRELLGSVPESNVEVVAISPEVDEPAASYIQEGAVSPRMRADALHIALATPLMQLEGMLDFKNKKSRQ